MSILDDMFSLDVIGEEAIVQALGVASMAVLGPAGPTLVNALNNGRKTVKTIQRIENIVNTVKEHGEYKPMSNGEKGIKETKEILFFVFSFTRAMQLAMEDGDFSWTDARHFIEPAKAIMEAADNVSDVIPEIADITPDEMAELVAYVKEEFDIEDDALEAKIESALDAGVELLGMVHKLKLI